jgi:hypothetical protein
MNDDNRVFISDSLKDLIDIDQKEEKISNLEIKKDLKQEIICKIKNFSSEFFGILTEYSKKKRKTKLKIIINAKAFTGILIEQINNVEIKSIFDMENYLYQYDNENYDILYSIKYKSENIYILNLEIKEHNHE